MPPSLDDFALPRSWCQYLGGGRLCHRAAYHMHRKGRRRLTRKRKIRTVRNWGIKKYSTWSSADGLISKEKTRDDAGIHQDRGKRVGDPFFFGGGVDSSGHRHLQQANTHSNVQRPRPTKRPQHSSGPTDRPPTLRTHTTASPQWDERVH